jgi:hypothetical protein
MSGPLDFTNQNIEDTYQRVLQTDGTDIYDGTGSLFTVTAVAAPAGPNQSIQFNDAGTTSGSGDFTFNKSTNVVSLTGSISALYGFTGSLLGTAATASNTPNALITGSITNNVITLNKGDGSSFTLTVDTGSGGTPTSTGSLLVTASATLNQVTFTKGDTSQFTITIDTGSAVSIDTGSFVTTSSFNSFTSSYNTGSFTGSFTGSLFGTASWATTASYALNGGVTRLIAGPNITLSPTTGLGQVTISSTGGGGGTGNTATGSYGSFYSTITQTNPVGNVPRSMSFNTTDISNGVSISGSTNPFNTYIKTENAGVYDIQFSAQLDKTDSGTDEILIWLRKNGIDLTDTATTISLVGNNAKNVAAWNFFVNSAANDYYQLIWYSPDTSVRLLAEVAGGGHPGIPSVILTVNRVDQFLSNTGSFTGSFTGELIGTASWATNALTASFVTASNVYGPFGSNSILSASYATNSTTQAALDNSTKIATTAYVDSTTATLPANDQFILASQIFS